VGADAVIPRPMISTSPPYPVQKTPPATTVMVDTAAATPNSVAYVGISFRDAIAKAGLGTSPLKNQNGKFVLPTAETIDADASVLDPRTPPDQRLSLVFATTDDSYPLINYEYAVVSIRQANPETAAALRQFLQWATKCSYHAAGNHDTCPSVPI